MRPEADGLAPRRILRIRAAAIARERVSTADHGAAHIRAGCTAFAKATAEIVMAGDAARHVLPRDQARERGGGGRAAVECGPGRKAAGIATRRRMDADQAHHPVPEGKGLAVQDAHMGGGRVPDVFARRRAEQVGGQHHREKDGGRDKRNHRQGRAPDARPATTARKDAATFQHALTANATLTAVQRERAPLTEM
jgi:hypothetical protein